MEEDKSDDPCCTLCNSILDESTLSADAFGNAQDLDDDEIFVVLRCYGCARKTVICDGGES